MRTIAFDIVFGTLEREKHSDELFLAQIGNRNTISEKEKDFLRRLSYGTIERAIESDAVINYFSTLPVIKMKPEIRTLLRMGVYELFYMDSVPPSATCNEMVMLAKKKGYDSLSRFVNGVLRNIAREDSEALREKIADGCRTAGQRLSFRYSVPEDLVEMLMQTYGKKTTEKILASFYEDRPVTIRVQTANASKEQVRQELIQAGAAVEDGTYVDTALTIRDFRQIDCLPGFREGHFTVQDESSMLPVLAAELQHGDIVVDLCSSPGGKTFHALDVLGGTGFVSARDVSAKKLVRINENAGRLRVKDGCLEIKVWDATVPDEEWRESADVVFADVPCSGIGVIGKKPEIKYHAMEHARELIPIQREIVCGAVSALKPGGTLIYSTCTIHPGENEEMAEWIRNEFPLKPVSLDTGLPEKLHNGMTRRGMLQMLPGLQRGDGFFVAKFRKV